MTIVCPKCRTEPFQHWALGTMHKCHVCKHIWRE
jgi:hypothetical protein